MQVILCKHVVTNHFLLEYHGYHPNANISPRHWIAFFNL
jgi:hypothetical protein